MSRTNIDIDDEACQTVMDRYHLKSAAALHRACRRRGESVRKLVDCLIAAIANREAVTVLPLPSLDDRAHRTLTRVSGEQWAVWVAGAAAPPEESFRGCIEAVADEVQSLPKGLELFASEHPVDDYSFATEIGGIHRAMDADGIERAHFVGYSGGGGVAMAFALEHPERVISLAVDEHVIGHHLGVDDEDLFWAELDAALGREGLEGTLGVVAATNAPGATPPDFGDPPPPWLGSRVVGTPLLARAARDYPVSLDDLARIRCPVYAAYGSETRTAFKEWCEALAATVRSGVADSYEGCDHFRPAHEIHPARFAEALLAHWRTSQQ